MKIKRINEEKFEPFTIQVDTMEEATVLFAAVGFLAPDSFPSIRGNDYYPKSIQKEAHKITTCSINAITANFATSVRALLPLCRN